MAFLEVALKSSEIQGIFSNFSHFSQILAKMVFVCGVVPFVMVNRIRQGRSLSRRGVPGHVRVYLDTFGYTSMPSHEIYDIGTEILFLQ